jgi:hypothetical protein
MNAFEEAIVKDCIVLYKPGQIGVTELSNGQLKIFGYCFACFGNGRIYRAGDYELCFRCNGSRFISYVRKAVKQ